MNGEHQVSIRTLKPPGRLPTEECVGVDVKGAPTKLLLSHIPLNLQKWSPETGDFCHYDIFGKPRSLLSGTPAVHLRRVNVQSCSTKASPGFQLRFLTHGFALSTSVA